VWGIRRVRDGAGDGLTRSPASASVLAAAVPTPGRRCTAQKMLDSMGLEAFAERDPA